MSGKSFVHGFYSELALEEITHRVDWILKKDYLRISYSGRLPMLVEFIPMLEQWKAIEVRKVRERIESVQKSMGQKVR